jgi:GNAT superfamily N-acetyltransferase
MNNRILSYRLWESKYKSFGSMGLRIPEHIRISDDDKDIVRRIGWSDLDWNEIGDDGNSIIWLEMKLPIDLDISKGVIVDIQLIQNTFYQIHISLSEDLRGLGLGTKIYRSLVEWAGHLYSGKGRRHNPIINNVWKNLKSEAGVTCSRNDLGDICVSNKNPDKDKLLNRFNSI